jgi:hypothetical protein
MTSKSIARPGTFVLHRWLEAGANRKQVRQAGRQVGLPCSGRWKTNGHRVLETMSPPGPGRVEVALRDLQDALSCCIVKYLAWSERAGRFHRL